MWKQTEQKMKNRLDVGVVAATLEKAYSHSLATVVAIIVFNARFGDQTVQRPRVCVAKYKSSENGTCDGKLVCSL